MESTFAIHEAIQIITILVTYLAQWVVNFSIHFLYVL